jgi:hypothetical protein
MLRGGGALRFAPFLTVLLNFQQFVNGRGWIDDNKSTMGRQPLTMRLDAGLAQVFVGSPDALGYVEAVGRALKN